jgi:hypothetical protein
MVRDNGNCLLARSNYNWNLGNLGKPKRKKKEEIWYLKGWNSQNLFSYN